MGGRRYPFNGNVVIVVPQDQSLLDTANGSFGGRPGLTCPSYPDPVCSYADTESRNKADTCL